MYTKIHKLNVLEMPDSCFGDFMHDLFYKDLRVMQIELAELKQMFADADIIINDGKVLKNKFGETYKG